MYVCKAGHMAIRKARQGKKEIATNQVNTYYFDIEKCKVCPMREGCYKDGAKSKTYNIVILSEEQKSQLAFEESDYFKMRIKDRYMIEAKNAELKQNHGLERCRYLVLFSMRIQSY